MLPYISAASNTANTRTSSIKAVCQPVDRFYSLESGPFAANWNLQIGAPRSKIPSSMDSLLNSTDCTSETKDTLPASKLSAVMQMSVDTPGAASPAVTSPFKTLSGKILHDLHKVSRSTSATTADSLPILDHQHSSRWTGATLPASAGSSICGPCGTDDAARQQHDQQNFTRHQTTNTDAEQTSRVDLHDLPAAAATASSARASTAACRTMPAASSSSSSSTAANSRHVPPPVLSLHELQQRQHHDDSKHHQQHWISRPMPAQPSPAAAATGRC
ncbi:hypothetical protein COO60DRAFT_468221 [Scenedesmus sp. NREL 46B-D3]|nr:hypothetical protein COO60DRAFT_468221 [Scenedesmus sp. NREL 46B-D3]